ncbi:MAG: CvpA family protein [Gammaproteobacteria bacterium]|nr:CvpA family protein [Gammaproteobacteria bacterium]TVQ47357.1 MAG: CvpA family protein [Gammaproteobacteria bacterium]
MSVVDYALIVLVSISVLIGFVRGFVREAVSLAALVLAVWVALRYAWVLDPWLGALDESPTIQLWVARGSLFFGVLIGGMLVNLVLGLLVRGTGLTGTDRMLGMLFGFGRGVALVGVLVIGGQFAGMTTDPWWQQSRLIPYGEQLADGIRALAEEAGDRLMTREWQ